MIESYRMTRPDDWHVHLRSDALLSCVVPYTARQFGRALIMPNLTPPVTTVKAAIRYRQGILDCLPANTKFDPKMSIYLTDNTSKKDVEEASTCPHVLSFKLYPAGATTNSSSGVTKISRLMSIFESMANSRIVLQVHGETTDTHIDIFDRETVFIEQILAPLHQEIPELKIVLEHITTDDSVNFVKQAGSNVAGTITPQHLMYSRNEIFKGGLRPHYYCLPILKREQHRQKLVAAATSGDLSFFLGTDSAPHIRSAKEGNYGCAGIFSAHAAIEFYADVFDSADALPMLEGFASHYGADFYNLPRNKDKVILVKKNQHIPPSIVVDSLSNSTEEIIPLMAGQCLNWSLETCV